MTARTAAGAGREVLVTWPDYDLEAQGLGGALAAAGLEIRLEPKRGRRDRGEMFGIVGAAAAAIVSTDPFDAAILDASPRLRVIARVGIGVDSIDLAAATSRGIAVTITPGANEETVADHTLALMLASVRRICEHDRGIRGGAWNRTGDHTPWNLTGATVGLVGYGKIGRLVEERLRGFDVEVLVADPALDDDPRQVTLDELLCEANVISLHVPLLPQTMHLIGERELAAMRRDAILVNTARGGVVDESALLAALAAGHLRGAALDVFEEEPPRLVERIDLPNLVLSPHNGGISVESIEEMTRRATASVLDVFAGRRPRHLANPEVELDRSLARTGGGDA